MDRYVVLKRVGDGTYGEVILATNKQTGEKVHCRCSTPVCIIPLCIAPPPLQSGASRIVTSPLPGPLKPRRLPRAGRGQRRTDADWRSPG